MKTFLLILIFLSSSLLIFGQGKTHTKITGKVTDSTSGKPIDYATISLFLQNDKKATNGTTTDSTGAFEIKDAAAGNYKIVVEFIGYKAYTINNVALTQSGTIDLKTIRLVKRTAQFKDVTVTTQQGLIENKIDK